MLFSFSYWLIVSFKKKLNHKNYVYNIVFILQLNKDSVPNLNSIMDELNRTAHLMREAGENVTAVSFLFNMFKGIDLFSWLLVFEDWGKIVFSWSLKVVNFSYLFLVLKRVRIFCYKLTNETNLNKKWWHGYVILQSLRDNCIWACWEIMRYEPL